MDDELTELYDAEIPRVDLVDKAANGTRFLIAKNQGRGLVDADTVRELIGKAAPPTTEPDQVTLTGSPAAIMRMIHESGVAKAERSSSAAKKFGIEVAKDMDDDMDDMDLASEPLLAEDDNDMPGMATDPGSPAWEQIDADTACKWTAVLARARAAVELLADREMIEATSADPDDADNAFNLQDACCAIDYAISVLAPFAVAEQAEADVGVEQMSMVGKALDGFDPTTLDTIEVLGRVQKAGRVLSSKNEATIRIAVESLQKVLASLPQAPETTDESGRPVAKEEQIMADTTEAATQKTATETVEKTTEPAETIDAKPAEKATPVEKADAVEGKTPQVAVYDSQGNLVGIVDPDDVTPISGADKVDDGGDKVVASEGATATDDAQTEDSDLTPAPAGEVGTPADAVEDEDDVTKNTVPDTKTTTTSTDTDAVLKSIVTDAVTAALADYSATHKEDVAKQAAVIDELTSTVETLKGQVEAYGEQPAPPKVFTNGAVPPAHMMRGQDRGAAPVDVAKAAEMRQSLYKSHDAIEQNRIAEEMKASAIDALQAIHRGAPPQ